MNSSNIVSLENSDASEDLKINTVLNKKTLVDSSIILPTGIPTNTPSLKITDVTQPNSTSPHSSNSGDSNKENDTVLIQDEGMKDSPKSLSGESLIVEQDNYDNYQGSFSPSSDLDELEDIGNPVF
eukprot:CAMPEP_0196765878 /NCGR_PEP_ID=MMETSP1095-20130614/14723_1 /TAXON_ID=96789 ORGANISM="Chromulina nebulosa, Strain UTEXLB2642" /NCGR_SAMPLE_ID=MMETSP1095 /ASSEMBLY_ACC=CAM_ASM_000446 /LENGTH=125 /DNA_ID=CAMNT_0042125037 /DNA_START=728 /DNA_END=1108 /DNA_ORIENTATION=+